MPCSVRSTSAPIVRRRSVLPSRPPARIAAQLNLDDPGERQAEETLRRFTTGRWPLWRLLGIHRDGMVLYCAVEWLRTGKGRHPEKYALAELALDRVSVRWNYFGSAAAVRSALQAKAEGTSAT